MISRAQEIYDNLTDPKYELPDEEDVSDFERDYDQEEYDKQWETENNGN